MDQQVLTPTKVTTRSNNRKLMREDGVTYLRCERPIIERSENQSPILDIQSPDLLFDVDSFFRWKIWIRERLEEGLSPRR